ncbi:dTDP-glucose 4,6-dehydratase [Allomuricauda sp. SCSIO 65647]|uniref:dTDP-glucose 4,6-dehydratase n=1 Tax=Allomuricauda sp. SCSIO 65647 TaxID=2908843 RepID=UPI001F159B99|nr:dTDP-glucose 4,6-dehydratase [Muricauda sp. SCSIO 65647]UJH69048.1 dTDP-glucose 4,6-dehydratase [Muricauda sp. SCSIO 65647]
MQKTRKTILVTGGAGFIGSNFIKLYLDQREDIHIINLDKLTYAGNPENMSRFEKNENYTFVQGDICDASLVNRIFEEHNIGSVIHFAAESHVDNSIESPADFIKTNIEGTFTLLQVAKQHWLEEGNSDIENSISRFHHISTDEVYGSLGDEGFFDESSPYAPNSPYSASKAASDFLVRSYHHTYGMNVVISNCSNNYGPNQHKEKLIPTIIGKALAKESIPIYGDGLNVRDWLYVKDHCEAIQLVFENGISGETYAIGGNCEETNLNIARKICALLDAKAPMKNEHYSDLITFVKDRPGHDFRYAINSAKMYKSFDWRPSEDLHSGLEKTVDHYLEKYTAKT